MWYVAFEHLMSLLDSVLCLFILGSVLGIKENKKLPTLIFIAANYISAQYLSSEAALQTAMMLAANIIYALTSLKGKNFLKVMWSIVVAMLFVLVSFASFPLFSFFTGKPIKDIIISSDVNRIMVVLIIKIVQWAVAFIIVSVKGNMVFNNSGEKLLIIFILAANTVIQLKFLNFNYSYEFNGNEQKQLLIISMMIMAVLICSIFMIINVSNKNAKLIETELLKTQLESQTQVVQEIGKREEQIRIERHDLKHYVNMWYNLIAQNEVERASEEMKKYITKLDNIGTFGRYIKENDLINAVLYQKISECHSKEIKCSCECTTYFEKDKETDIAIIISNLMDNAIRAEELLESEEKQITIKISRKDDNNVIVIQNNIKSSVLESNPKLVTTKVDKKMHGIGLRSVREVAEKYNAIMDIKEKDNRFIVVIIGL